MAMHDGRSVVRRGRHARGGKPKINEYNAQGSPEAHEAEDQEPDFKRGGKTKLKHGGHAEGDKATTRLDRAPRGQAKHAKHAKGGHVHHQHDHAGDGAAVHHHHRAAGHAVHHHGDGDIHMHRKQGGAMHEKRARGGRTGHSPYSSASHLAQMKGDPGREDQQVPDSD